MKRPARWLLHLSNVARQYVLANLFHRVNQYLFFSSREYVHHSVKFFEVGAFDALFEPGSLGGENDLVEAPIRRVRSSTDVAGFLEEIHQPEDIGLSDHQLLAKLLMAEPLRAVRLQDHQNVELNV